MSQVLEDFQAALIRLAERGETRRLWVVEERWGPWVRLEGRWYLNLASNDYLGLAGGFSEADLRPILAESGFGSGASRLLSGNHVFYNALEEKLLALYGRPALVFGSGFLANVGVVSTLVSRRDVIFADKLVHASLIDGMRLSGATFFRFPHNDLEALAILLEKERRRFRRALIITESVFSMDGDLPDLRTLIQLKEEHEALLLLDEAHAIGVFGPRGLGLAEELGLLSKVDVLVGTFGKALGGYGAFVIVPEVLRKYLIHRARSFIFTTALPTVVVAAALWGLERAVERDTERKYLRALARRLRTALSQGPYHVPGQGLALESQIVPIIVGENQQALALSQRLREAGFWAPAIRPPTVPPHTARLRLSLTSQMRWEDLEPLVRLVTRR